MKPVQRIYCFYFMLLPIVLAVWQSQQTIADTVPQHTINLQEMLNLNESTEQTFSPSPLHCSQAQTRLTNVASLESAASMAISQEAFSTSSPFTTSGLPVAFGDFDSDHFVDMFLLTENGHVIEALKGQACSDGKTVLTYFGSRNCLTIWPELQCNFRQIIVNIVPSDFTGQSRLDLLVTVKNENAKKNEQLFRIFLASGGPEDMKCDQRKQLLENALSEPFVLDYNGDMISDFIVSTKDCPTFLWIGRIKSEETSSPLTSEQEESVQGVCLTNLTMDKEFKFAFPHSSAFLNLEKYDVNMMPDLFLSGNNEIFYIFNRVGLGFAASETKIIPYPSQNVRGQSSFADINYSGKMIHLIPVCLSKSTNFNSCKNIGVMALDNDTNSWINVLEPESKSEVNYRNRSLSFAEQTFFNEQLFVPVTLRIGDLNYDGYPDFVTILTDINLGRTFAAIFLNVKSDQNTFKRAFKLSWLSERTISEDIALVSLFDLYDNGRLNLLLTKRVKEQQEKLSTHPYDYYMDQSFYYSFLRVSVISGLCTDKPETGAKQCPLKNGKEQVALGSNPNGPSACFKGPFDGHQSCSAQLTQSAHFALQLPFMVFGLGDILNVVDDFSISIPNGQHSERVQTWDEIIPGSKLFIVPYPLDAPDKWSLRAYINMGIYSIISLAFLFGLGLLLTIAIYILHYRERKEDRQDQIEYKKHWL